jgi:hypothetical protein
MWLLKRLVCIFAGHLDSTIPIGEWGVALKACERCGSVRASMSPWENQ